MSCLSCGCDAEAHWMCKRHRGEVDQPVQELTRPTNPVPSKGDPRFHALLKQLGDLHDKKQEDYGVKGDPFANVRASTDWGIPAWVGCFTRLNDKVKRLQKFAQTGSLANESAEDSMLDIAVYALIGLILYREASEKK